MLEVRLDRLFAHFKACLGEMVKGTSEVLEKKQNAAQLSMNLYLSLHAINNKEIISLLEQ